MSAATEQKKHCPRCAQWFHREVFGIKANGQCQAYCRPCQKLRAQERRSLIAAKKAEEVAATVAYRAMHGKACVACKAVKPLFDFCSQPDRIDGKRSRCKACEQPWRKAMASERYRVKKDELRAKAREWEKANRTRTNERVRQARRLERQELADSYVKRLLSDRSEVIKPALLPPALVDLKREQLLLARLAKQMQQALTEKQEPKP